MPSSFDFGKSKRLLTRLQYKKVFSQVNARQGFKLSHRYFRAFCATNTLDHPRLGLVLTKKAIKKAVERNRIKRIIREQFRLLKEDLKGDIIIIANHSCDELSNPEIHRQLKKLWASLQKRYKVSSSGQSGSTNG